MAVEVNYEKVEHPDHYNWHPVAECITVIEWFSFNTGNAIKYIWRAGKKPGEDSIEDLEKAKFYIEQEIARINEERKRKLKGLLDKEINKTLKSVDIAKSP